MLHHIKVNKKERKEYEQDLKINVHLRRKTKEHVSQNVCSIRLLIANISDLRILKTIF